MMVRNELWLAVAVLLTVPAAAAGPVAERRLSPAEVEQILEDAAVKNKAAAKSAKPLPKAVRPIEGEVGVSVGSGNYREMFGTAIIPVGGDGVAIVSVGNAEADRDTKRRRR